MLTLGKKPLYTKEAPQPIKILERIFETTFDIGNPIVSIATKKRKISIVR